MLQGIAALRTPIGNSHLHWALVHGWTGLALLVGGAIFWFVPRDQRVVVLTVTDHVKERHSYSFAREDAHDLWRFAGVLAGASAELFRP